MWVYLKEYLKLNSVNIIVNDMWGSILNRTSHLFLIVMHFLPWEGGDSVTRQGSCLCLVRLTCMGKVVLHSLLCFQEKH